MKIVFASNFYNHHQSELAQNLFRLTNGEYYFIETEPIEEERTKLGWGEKVMPSYVKQSYTSAENYNECQSLINSADVVIYGSAPESMIKNRLKAEKLTFKYSERLYKEGFKWYEQPLRFIKNNLRGWSKKNHYLLCASAYSYADYQKTFNFTNRAYKWGYFPAVKPYDDIKRLIKNKEKSSLLWAARFIDWKHPEIPILIAERLKKAGYKFKLNLIGNGVMEKQIDEMIKEKGLEDCVFMLGAMKPGEVRLHMEKSQIFLFTSDFKEGWGAVLNESMNSGCAVVASHAIGSVPYLIEDGKNGLIYKNGDIDDLYNKVKYLLDNPEKSEGIGKNAYETLKITWNAKVAAERFVVLATKLLNGENIENLYDNGPCSKAEILKNNWYKKNEYI